MTSETSLSKVVRDPNADAGAPILGTIYLKPLKSDLVFVMFILALRIGSPSTASLAYVALAVFAFGGPTHVIKALMLSWLCTMINPGVAPFPTIGSIGRYLVLFSTALSALWWSKFARPRAQLTWMGLATGGLGALIMVHSGLISPFADVSILKAASWTTVMMTLFSVWSQMSIQQRNQTTSFMFFFLISLAILSLPLLAVNGIGRLRNGTGFQGFLNHPQAFGPTMGLLAGWSVSQFVSQHRPSFVLISTAGLSLTLVLLSEARTGGLAVMVGLVSAAFVIPILTGIRPRILFPGLRSARFYFIFMVLFFVIVLLSSQIIASLDFYLSKSGRAGDEIGIVEAYGRSRGGLVEGMILNIQQFPFFGIGFGIASNPSTMEIIRDPILGLPTGASIEKGVIPIMIVEELGIFISPLLGLWIFFLVKNAALGGYTPLAIVLSILSLNMGEAVLFSPGGQGLLVMILLTWAASNKNSVQDRRKDV